MYDGRIKCSPVLRVSYLRREAAVFIPRQTDDSGEARLLCPEAETSQPGQVSTGAVVPSRSHQPLQQSLLGSSRADDAGPALVREVVGSSTHRLSLVM